MVVVLALVPTALQGAVLAVGLLFSLVAGWRAFRISIELDGVQVVVRNLLRTHRFSWSDVEEIRPSAETIIGVLWETLGFQMRSGRLVSAQAASGRLRVRASALAVLLPFARREGVRISTGLSREMEELSDPSPEAPS
jgi:Bacterial PH domain